MAQEQGIGQARPWGLWVVMGTAAGSILLGGALTLRSVDRAAAEAHREAERGQARHGTKPPTTFGLPAYPTAFQFHSLEIGGDSGSASFSVKRGSAGAIAAFYRKKLENQGWRIQWRVPISQRPGNPALADARIATGVRLRWRKKSDPRQITLLALDYPSSTSTAQALLTWAPSDPSTDPSPPASVP